MRARDLVDIRHIENVDNGSYDVTEFRAGLRKRRPDRGDCGHHLRVGIAIEVLTAGRRSGNKHLIPNADGAPIAVCVLERIARREIGSDQRSTPPRCCCSRHACEWMYSRRYTKKTGQVASGEIMVTRSN